MPQINRPALDAFKNLRLDSPDLKGKALDDAERTKAVDNGVSTINFFSKDAQHGVIPFLNADPAPVTDAQRLDKVIAATPEQLAALKNDPAAFAALIKQTLADKKAYLQPTKDQVQGATTFYRFNAIVGQRIDQFIDEGVKLAQELYGRDVGKLNQALYAVNTTGFDLYSREVKFDEFETNGYASFGHDAAFIHAWEKRLGELSKIDLNLLTPDEKSGVEREKQQLQGELDAIFRSKYVYNNSQMFEVNAEVSIGLCLIDKASRQRASEVEATRDSVVPRFEILNVMHEGQNKAVYFDVAENKYYFDKSDQVVPQELVPQIQRRAVDDDALTFRRAESGEHLRKNFRFDWNGDGYVQKSVVDWVSWAGHCDIKAMLETHGLVLPQTHAGVYEYDSRSGSTAHYSRDILNEKLLGMGELSSEMRDVRTGRTFSVANEPTAFAGARDDDRPDRLLLGGNVKVPYNDRPNEFTITKIVTADKTYDSDKVFAEHLIADDQRSATKNPLFNKMVEGDRVELKLGQAAIHAKANFQVFDEQSGYTTMKSADVVLDFKNPAAAPILVDTVMADAGQRLMWEISVDTKNKQWIAQQVQMVKKADGSGFEKKNVGQAQKQAIDPNNVMAQRETSLDNPAVYMPFVKEALQTGKNFTSETADGAGVWNGRTKRLKQATVWRDDNTKWARVDIETEARYGGNKGGFLVKLKDDGKPDFFVPLAMPFDFAWRNDAAFAPVMGDAVNETALERGLVSKVGNRFTAESFSNMLELLHCAFNDRRYVINHNGQRYFFDSKEAWDAAKLKLDQARAAVYGGGAEPGPLPITVGTLLDTKGVEVAKGATVQHQLVAEADGEMVVKLNTKVGDADLYLNVGGPASSEDGKHTHKSWKSDLELDEIKIQVKKGDVIGIAVQGYKGSTFDLEVTGPKAGAVVEPQPEPVGINVKAAGVLERGKWQNVDQYPIEVKEDGVLRFTMSGSGDADVYVGVNREPDNRRSDWRLADSTSNETGTLKVKKGDKIYARVYGYAPRSDFDLSIKSE